MNWLTPHPPRLDTASLARLRTRGWNRRILTFDIFEDFCADENITVINTPMPRKPGEYKIEHGRDVIKLDLNLHEPKLTLVAFHEIGHWLYHVPGCFSVQTKTETEADFIGHAAIIPLHLIKHFKDWEIADEYGYPLALVQERRRLHEIYKARPRQKRWYT